MDKRYCLTPPTIYMVFTSELNEAFNNEAFNFDACPSPCSMYSLCKIHSPEGYDSLEVDWGTSKLVNPPYVVSPAVKQISIPSYKNLWEIKSSWRPKMSHNMSN